MGGRKIMYIVILASVAVVSVMGILYSCAAVSTYYDKQVDDSAQEDFLHHYQKQAQKKK